MNDTNVLHKKLDISFDAALDHVPAKLKEHGFGVLTTIDVSKTLKSKLDVDVPPYMILGACNPKMAHEALQVDPTVGVFLPCNVIVRQLDDGVEVRAVDPLDSLGGREPLRAIASKVREMLATAVGQM